MPPRSLPMQMLAVAAAALALAFAANALHPGGLELGRDYFRKPQHEFQTLPAADFAEYAKYFRDPAGDFLCLDVRRRAQYERGHVPGAWSVPRNDAAALAEAAARAKSEETPLSALVLYCQGGDCEDSILTAEDLVYRHGVLPELVYIYEGGWEEWTESGGAVQKGAER